MPHAGIPTILFLSMAAAAAQTTSPDVVQLRNQHLQLTFTRDGRLAGFTPVASNDNYLKAAKQLPSLIDVTVGNADGSGQIKGSPVSPRVSISNGEAVIDSDLVRTSAGDVPVAIRVTVELASATAESRWVVQLRNRDAQRSIFGVTLPRIYGVRLGANSNDDSLYLPYWGGERFPHAVQDFADIAEKRLSPVEMGSSRIKKEDGRYIRELTYAGGASMMWLDYVDPQHGLYLASYDPKFLVTVLHADTAGLGAGAMNFEFQKWITVRAGHEATLAPFIVAAHGPDWHWAADRYRSWFRTQTPVSFEGGKWRDQIGGWMPFLKNAYGKIGYRFSDVPGLWDQERKFGMDLIDPYGWSRGGFDSQDPEYYPDLDLGGPVDMARAWRKIREEGGQIITYINARIFNRNSLYFSSLGQEAAARKPDGSYFIEQYAPGSPESFAVMCPASMRWKKLLIDFGTAAVTQYGSQLIYYDQVAASRPSACYSPNHGHDGPELWNQKYREFLREAIDTDRQVSPATAFMIEGAADLYAPYALFQGYFCPRYAGTDFAFPELLKYTFPEIIQATFFLNSRNSRHTIYPGIPTLPREVARYWLARDILLGKLFVFMDPVTGDHEWWEETAKLLAIRKAAAPWMGNGIFRDTLDVTHADSSLEVKTYRWQKSEKFSTLAAVLNPERRDGLQISIHFDDGVTGLHAFRLSPDGSQHTIPLVAANGNAIFGCGPDLLSMIVIEAR